MNPFKVLGIIVGICVLSYFLYFSWESGNVPKTIDIGTANSFKSIPATVCTLGNESGSLTGMLYVFHDGARFDITSTKAGAPISVHIVVSHEDMAYYWVDGEKTGSKGEYGPVYNKVGLEVITHVDCSQWWLPNGALFIVPQDISFT